MVKKKKKKKQLIICFGIFLVRHGQNLGVNKGKKHNLVIFNISINAYTFFI